MLTLQSVGDELRELRRDRGMTMIELSKAVGLTQGAISRIEAGKKYPSFDALVRLVEALDAELVIIRREDRLD